jgi:threonine dehydrogenase-like Zn-dependent dehydrogenase
VRGGASVSTASAPRPISWRKSAAGKAARSTSPGDAAAQAHARSLGARWAGDSDEDPPEPLDAAIIFAPVGALVPRALAAVRKAGRVVCGGIYMSDIPAFPYRIRWEKGQIASVANLTRQDAIEFLAIASKASVRTTTTAYPLEHATQALDDLPLTSCLSRQAILYPRSLISSGASSPRSAWPEAFFFGLALSVPERRRARREQSARA